MKDAGGQPVPNATATIDFSVCVTGGEIRRCAVEPDPNIAVSCAGHAVTAITDAGGVARFHIVGCAMNTGGGGFNASAPGYGAYGPVDLALWLKLHMAGGSAASCASARP